MSTTYVQGDLFDFADTHIIGQGVNCKGKMGAGIAWGFANRYPTMRSFYRQVCDQDALRPGGVLPWFDPTTGHDIVNIASQDFPGADARIGWLRSGVWLAAAYAVCRDRPLALPWIGCGIGGLDMAPVREVFDNVGSFVLDLTVVSL